MGRALPVATVGDGREGPVATVTFTGLSNIRRNVGEERQDETTSILRTVWGKAAENAAPHLGKGSHVNVVGTLRNNNYENAEGVTVYAMAFTAEEIDYLGNKAQADARQSGTISSKR